MQDKIDKLMKENNLTYRELAQKLNISNHTLTRKIKGETEWTFSEMMLMANLFHIQDPQSFFFN